MKTMAEVTAMVVVGWLGVSCAPLPGRAPFVRVPGSVTQGSLAGPFAGRVLDAGTGQPIRGATVYAAWRYEQGVGIGSPAGYRQYRIVTDADGCYRVPSVRELRDAVLHVKLVGGVRLLVPGKHGSGSGGKLVGFSLVVYKKGYVAYRSDRLFASGRPRFDFSQYDNVVRLERWNLQMDHRRHILFIGAVDRLGGAAQEEWALVEGKAIGHRTHGGRPVLDVSGFLTGDDIETLLSVHMMFETGRLATLKRTADVDSIHFKAVGKPQTYDLAYRVWRLSPGRLTSFYRKLYQEYPNSRSVDLVGNRSFEAGNATVLAQVFLDRKHSVVVSVTCGTQLCPSHKKLVTVARLLQERLVRLEGASGPPTFHMGQHSPKKPTFVPSLRR
ncbi:MAG: hypothetical protein J7M25_17550 [Deltaproteobacteria bacterium]|nr:hypothetical protein [Deltaproteobacteria bacterium]